MDRLFLDANILFSAAWRPDSRLRDLWTIPGVQLLTSAYALAEAVRNLQRPEQLERLRYLVASVEVIQEWDHVPLSDDIRLPDKDRPILQGALAAQATHLITGDLRDFGGYLGRTLSGIEVLLPAAYLGRRS